MFTWTNRPYETMWDHLKIFCYKANVINLLKGKIESRRRFSYIDKDIIEKKSSQVAYSISQAYEYFKAADTVTINTSPLLYFYGMLSLAKALIVANNHSLFLESIKYHGLYTRPISPELQAYVENETQWCIEKEYAVTNQGVFQELTDITQGFKFLEHTIIEYKNILSVDPEIYEIYNRYYNEPAKVQYLYSMHTETNPYSIELCPRTTDRNGFEARFPEFVENFDFQEGLIAHKALAYRTKPHITSFPLNIGIYHPMAGGKYLIGGLPHKLDGNIHSLYVSPELCDYINMFILSSCVRYKQGFWGKIVQGDVDGSLGLINLSISVARTRFPNFILNHLFGEKFEYGTAARYM